MRIVINIKRTAITTLACFVAAILPLYISNTEILTPVLFSIAIPLTNMDRIITRKKYQAFLLSIIFTIIIFFFSMMMLFFLGHSDLKVYSFYLISVTSGLLTLLVNSIFIQIDNIKLGIGVTGLLALLIFPLTIYLRGYQFLGVVLFDTPAIFLIIWQIVIGFAISITIWASTYVKNK